jgi:hypothetical protein
MHRQSSLTTFANFLRIVILDGLAVPWLRPFLTVGVCHHIPPSPNSFFHDETTQTKDKHMSKLAFASEDDTSHD